MEKETMSKYTIYCTKSQTEKAVKLGAPIDSINDYTAPNHPSFVDITHKGNAWFLPTTEQMIGWLRTKGFAFGITDYNDGFHDHVFWRAVNKFDRKWYVCDDSLKDIKDAILAAIDAALEYLEKQKGE